MWTCPLHPEVMYDNKNVRAPELEQLNSSLPCVYTVLQNTRGGTAPVSQAV